MEGDMSVLCPLVLRFHFDLLIKISFWTECWNLFIGQWLHASLKSIHYPWDWYFAQWLNLSGNAKLKQAYNLNSHPYPESLVLHSFYCWTLSAIVSWKMNPHEVWPLTDSPEMMDSTAICHPLSFSFLNMSSSVPLLWLSGLVTGVTINITSPVTSACERQRTGIDIYCWSY